MQILSAEERSFVHIKNNLVYHYIPYISWTTQTCRTSLTSSGRSCLARSDGFPVNSGSRISTYDSGLRFRLSSTEFLKSKTVSRSAYRFRYGSRQRFRLLSTTTDYDSHPAVSDLVTKPYSTILNLVLEFKSSDQTWFLIGHFSSVIMLDSNS
jgi:hypothetical protein